MLPLDTIICGNNVDVLKGFPDASIDLAVTSPPYDKLRAYQGYSFDFEGVAQELYRVTKPGGVVVWVVGDATVKGSETGTSFRQALRFMEIGFTLHDTMIYEKSGGGARGSNFAYWQSFEFMFVFGKGPLRTCNLIEDRQNVKHAQGITAMRAGGRRNKDGSLTPTRLLEVKPFGRRKNIWRYATGPNEESKDHPAPFPEALAADHILSWSNPGDVVLDPFNGSGTTCKMALMHGRRYIGIDVSDEYCDIARKRLQGVQASLGVSI